MRGFPGPVSQPSASLRSWYNRLLPSRVSVKMKVFFPRYLVTCSLCYPACAPLAYWPGWWWRVMPFQRQDRLAVPAGTQPPLRSSLPRRAGSGLPPLQEHPPAWQRSAARQQALPIVQQNAANNRCAASNAAAAALFVRRWFRCRYGPRRAEPALAHSLHRHQTDDYSRWSSSGGSAFPS